jgi:hypothetical protein
MPAVRKPNANVYDHGARPDSSQRAFAQWYRMLAQGTVEMLIQQHRHPLEIKPDNSCRSLDISQLRITTAGSVRAAG